MGQHSPKLGQPSSKLGPHNLKRGQHSRQDGPTWPQDMPTDYTQPTTNTDPATPHLTAQPRATTIALHKPSSPNTDRPPCKKGSKHPSTPNPHARTPTDQPQPTHPEPKRANHHNHNNNNHHNNNNNRNRNHNHNHNNHNNQSWSLQEPLHLRPPPRPPWLGPWPAVARKRLNPAMPRRVVVAAKHSFSYPGARPCRRPSLKSFSLLGFSRFWGFGVGKKMVKFEDAFWRSLLGVFWSIFGQFFIIFWYCPRVKIV